MGGVSTKRKHAQVFEESISMSEDDQIRASRYRRSDLIREMTVGGTYWCKCWSYKDGTLYMMKNVELAQRRVSSGSVKNEVKMLRSLDHPNIIRLHEYFVFQKMHRLVLDFTYENYVSRLKRGKWINKKEQALVFLQIVLAVTYLHNLHIMHCALSIENIRFVHKKSSTPEVKLTGFEHATYVSEPTDILNPNTLYASPEMLKLGSCCYFPSEWWAVGVILFQIVYGAFPFKGEPKSATYFTNARQGNVKFPESHADTYDESLRDLIGKLLLVDPKHRGNDSHVMTSKWMVHYTSLDDNKEYEGYTLSLDERRRCPSDLMRYPAMPPPPPSSSASELSSDEESMSEYTSAGGNLSSSARSCGAIHE